MTVAIVVIKDDVKNTHVFSDENTLQHFWKALDKKSCSVFAVSRRKAHRKEGEVIEAGERWCPYCKASRKFVFNLLLDVNSCEICEVSDRDYYVRHYNGEN